MALQGAAVDAVNKRASMRSPPLFETPQPSRESWAFEAPTRRSVVITQPVIDPEYRNSTIIDEPRPRRKNGNRNSTIVDGNLTTGAGNRNTVFLETPSRPTGANLAAKSALRKSTADTPSLDSKDTFGLSGTPRRRPTGTGVTFDTKRHTIADPPTVTITSPLASNPTLYAAPKPSPLWEEDASDEIDERSASSISSGTLRDSDGGSPPLGMRTSLPPVRPTYKSEISDLYGINDDDFLNPNSNIQRPSVTSQLSDSSVTQKPLIQSENPQARPNADQIRNRRRSQASRISRATSGPISQTFGAGTTSMIYGGGNAGLRDVSHGSYGMNQNFNMVSHRASLWLAEEEQREDEKRKEKERKAKDRMSYAGNGYSSQPRSASSRPSGHGAAHKDKRLKRWVEVLYKWVKSTKNEMGHDRGGIRKENIQHTTI